VSGLPIATHGLVHIYHSDGHDVAALSGVDLDVRAGELVGLLGPSGAGKSTLLSLLGGLFRPSAGRVLVGTSDLATVTPRQLEALRAQEVSLMLQGAARNLLPYYTSRENVAFAQVAARRSGKELPDPGQILADIGLGDEADRPLAALTPGHLQLAAVAVAVATAPGVLLADEPTSQLDHRARDLVLQTIGWINSTLGTTVVLVTHDPEVAASLPRTVTIRDGRIGGEGRSGEEWAVVTGDGFLPLPAHALDHLPPGTLVRFHPVDGTYQLLLGGTADGSTDGSTHGRADGNGGRHRGPHGAGTAR
jgi:ABC-type lipoprotein export system ATPase subunit